MSPPAARCVQDVLGSKLRGMCLLSQVTFGPCRGPLGTTLCGAVPHFEGRWESKTSRARSRNVPYGKLAGSSPSAACALVRYNFLSGGSAWESNPPGTGLPPLNGFEDREAHRDLSTPAGID